MAISAGASGELHVVFGAGQVGAPLVLRLVEAGHRVRAVRRGAGGPGDGRIEWMRGDVLDAAFAARAAEGAAAVYNCVNPQYHQWSALLPPMVRNIQAAAAAARARLIVLDNLYAYGPTGGAPMTEATPLAATARKGALRRALFLELMAAHQRGEVRAAVARAADFCGPGVTESAVFRPQLYRALLAGRPAAIVVDPAPPHSYTDARDAAQALLVLGRGEQGLGRAWHVPTAAAQPTGAWIEQLAAALGARARIRRLPLWLLRVAGIFSPLVRELPEMAYQWQAPFLLDGSAFTRAFGLPARPIAESVAASAEWARRAYAAPAG